MQSSAVLQQSRQSYISANAMAYATFFPTGMVTVMLGPLLPTLAARWSLNDSQAGYLVSAQFLGALLGTLSSGLLLARFGFRWSVAIGQALMAGGVVCLTRGGFAVGAASVLCYGIGIGLTIPTGNLLIAEGNPQRRSAALNLLNLSWGLGAVSCPFFLAAFYKASGGESFLHAIGSLLVLLTAALIAFRDEAALPVQHPDRTEWSCLRCVVSPAAILLASLFFVYVGTENALGIWLASYANRMHGSPGRAWMTMSSYFYGTLLLGRALSAMSLRHLDDTKQARFGALLSLTGSVVMVLSHSVLAIAICSMLTGLGLSTLYPIAIASLSTSFGAQARNLGSFMFALSTLGGASMPWLVGLASTAFRNLRVGLLIPVAGCLFMLVVFSSARWRKLTI